MKRLLYALMLLWVAFVIGWAVRGFASHPGECLCPTCETQYLAEWEADQAELAQR